ncbi:flagellar export chaperone FlgN [Vibrio sp. DW001]|uniref:flagella synthesis protein FlgN n=1 Tax=unclassified Vibrio TaxID=2614977 RepID=UPI00189C8670|nr:MULTISPECIES: flagellar export chaperone FlgN [unclassified Vibrio]UGA54035.1 flagellar export chaperone FlgN [Vibrio sp. VB16]WED25908.1 flagellar export chaperone FlgN [Vibrio sp. DW001]
MAKLVDLVNYQLENAQQLSILLEKEKVAITSRTSSDIEVLAKEKLQLITQLQQSDQRIANHTDIEQLQTDESLKSKVELIRSVIHDCQQANEVNGEALQRAQLSYNKLNNLMQQSRGKIGMTYTSDGHTSTVSTLGTNIKA